MWLEKTTQLFYLFSLLSSWSLALSQPSILHSSPTTFPIYSYLLISSNLLHPSPILSLTLLAVSLRGEKIEAKASIHSVLTFPFIFTHMYPFICVFAHELFVFLFRTNLLCTKSLPLVYSRSSLQHFSFSSIAELLSPPVYRIILISTKHAQNFSNLLRTISLNRTSSSRKCPISLLPLTQFLKKQSIHQLKFRHSDGLHSHFHCFPPFLS